ncbi:uncharacterized protein LOC109713823 [Ananas comosus]|uniref:Uncharacterized protein LOC109713823 n=1 Tax=Ananas comosus TaxID=4615 RepID=A0A6P5FJN9_ANACO|nr:uncharacterized protein LOC109713823 [Ananas comosus]XP_020093643.1 uncharacterized protein LOC109713823 [Ananas comosus]XP_020093644.1 uncharacterized protein LOC109713823 [Ananas comosus]
MHAKTDSDATSLAASSPPRSPRRPIYYVRSPSHADAAEKMSLGGSSPGASPHHYAAHHLHLLRYASSPPIHHSRESSTARYSAPLKHAPWRKLSAAHSRGAGAGAAAAIGGGGDEEEEEEEEEEGGEGEERNLLRRYACLFLAFVLVFTLFSLILWGASKSYKPKVLVKSVVFESYNIQAGMDYTGVPTKMMSLNSTVRIAFRNPGTFFGVHVTSTPLDLYFYDLKVASGYIKEFYQPRQSGRVVTVGVGGRQVPLYGSVDRDGKSKGGTTAAVVPLNLAFVVRARAHVLGYLVKSKFYLRVRCALSLREAHLGSPVPAIASACHYRR